MPAISVVIPVYRAEAFLSELIQRLRLSLQPITEDYEILLVEDCGGDRSWELIQQEAASDSRIRGIQFSRNFGQHAATLCGIEHSKGEWIVTIDDDLEQDPDDIRNLYEKALQGYDLVYGVYPQRAHSLLRNLTSSIARKIFRRTIPQLNQDYTSFRCIRRRIARELCNCNTPFPFIDGYLSWVTNNYATVPVSHSSKTQGVSTYTPGALVRHMVNIFVTFSVVPLKFATWIGMAASLLGLAGFVVILYQKLTGRITLGGYASLMAAILLLGGVQMLILGILGEYLGIVNFKTSRRPVYIASRFAGMEEGTSREIGAREQVNG